MLIWWLERRRRHLRRKLIASGLSEREARAYLDCLYRLRGNGGHLDFDHPRTFCEKLNWLKLYHYDPLVCRCSDRLLLREYVAERLGGEFLVPLLATYDRAEDVDFGALPGRFALKVNGGSGLNVICPDRVQLDVADARRKLAYWMRPKANHYYDGLEWGYRGIVPKILAEEFLDDGGDLPDYKFYCFGGQPKVCAIVRGRAGAHPTATFYDEGYRRLPMTMRGWAAAGDDPPRPALWGRMLEAAATLAVPFPHVRVDFYAPAGGGLKVGELTFWTSNGLTPHEPREWDLKLGGLLTLPPKRSLQRIWRMTNLDHESHGKTQVMGMAEGGLKRRNDSFRQPLPMPLFFPCASVVPKAAMRSHSSNLCFSAPLC